MPIARVRKKVRENREIDKQFKELARLGLVIWEYGIAPEYSLMPPLIVGQERIVEDPGEFDNQFREGDRVLQIHFRVDNPRDFASLFNDMMSKLPGHKKAGYAGFYGDTPVTPIINHAERREDMVVIDPPEDAAERISKTYHKAVKQEGYPAEYDGKPVKRLIMRTPD